MAEHPHYSLDEEMSDAEHAAADLRDQIARIRRRVTDLREKLQQTEGGGENGESA